MLEKSRNAVFFQWFVCRVSRKVGLVNSRGCGGRCSAEKSKKLHTAVARSTFWSQNVKRVREHFLKFWCRKTAHRCGESTLWSQNAKKLRVPEHFLKFWCRKNARRCGEKHMCISKCTKFPCFGFLKFRCRKISQLASSSVNQSVN